MEDYQFLGAVANLNGQSIEIPLDKLETAGISPGSKVEIISNNYCVFIRQAERFCDVCQNNNGRIFEVGNLKLCSDCLEKIKQIDNGGETQ